MLHSHEAILPIDKLGDIMASMSPQKDSYSELVAALHECGLDRPNLTIAPVLQGALAREMEDFVDKMLLPMMIRVLQNNGTLNTSLAGTIGVE
jgi:hypothetical protein